MANAPETTIKANLDIGGVISSTFHVYSRNFLYFFATFFVPYLAMQLVFTFGFSEGSVVLQGRDSARFWIQFALTFGISIVVLLLIQAVQVRSAVSIKLGRGVEFAAALQSAVSGLIPIIVLGFIAAIAIGVGAMFLIVPGLYLAAMFFVMVPAIVFEGRGFGGLGRSIALTSGYRWPIVGLFLIYFAVSLGVGLVIAIIAGIFMFAASVSGGDVLEISTSQTYLFIMIGLDALVNSVVYPITLIAGGMVFVRLREIKEGGDTTDLLKVFE